MKDTLNMFIVSKYLDNKMTETKLETSYILVRTIPSSDYKNMHMVGRS